MMIKLKKHDKLKALLYEIIFGADTYWGKAFDVALMIAILASTLIVMFSSLVTIKWLSIILTIIEVLITILFTAEYIIRIYCCPKPSKYVSSFFGIIDLVSILPVYLMIFVSNARYMMILRTFRLIRVFRVYKLFNFLNEGYYLLSSIKRSARKILVFFLFIVILVICLGSMMYMVEGNVEGTYFTNVPNGIYWAIVTLTTVGYGDITPVTAFGKFLSALVMLLGYTIIAVPTGIITANIATDVYNKNKSKEKCPRCGHTIENYNANYCEKCGEKLEKND